MTALVWDQVGDRRYETGVDHGVLYVIGGAAVPWNGLTSIVESRSRETKSFYLDGIKYLEHVVPGEYAAKLSAFTYPQQLDLLWGSMNVAPGVTVYDQRTLPFHLSYRTQVGNDLEGMDYAYKIHIIYNVIAIPTDAGFDTLGESVSAKPFEWDLKATPNRMVGMRPSSHISLDSRTIDPTLLATLKTRLYGSASASPNLPDFATLLALVS